MLKSDMNLAGSLQLQGDMEGSTVQWKVWALLCVD